MPFRWGELCIQELCADSVLRGIHGAPHTEIVKAHSRMKSEETWLEGKVQIMPTESSLLDTPGPSHLSDFFRLMGSVQGNGSRLLSDDLAGTL